MEEVGLPWVGGCGGGARAAGAGVQGRLRVDSGCGGAGEDERVELERTDRGVGAVDGKAADLSAVRPDHQGCHVGFFEGIHEGGYLVVL